MLGGGNKTENYIDLGDIWGLYRDQGSGDQIGITL